MCSCVVVALLPFWLKATSARTLSFFPPSLNPTRGTLFLVCVLQAIRSWGTGVAKSLRGSGVIKLGLIRARFDYLRGAAAHDAREPVTRTLENRVTLPWRTGLSGGVTRRPPTAKRPALTSWRLALISGLHAQACGKRRAVDANQTAHASTGSRSQSGWGVDVTHAQAPGCCVARAT